MELGPTRGALQYAHPGFFKAAAACRDSGKAYPWQDFYNASGHLHWRATRLRWIRGDIWPHSFPRSLGILCDSKEAIVEPSDRNSCAWALAAVARFYVAWRHLLLALRKGDGELLVAGLTHYAMYLQMKHGSEPLFLQEEQFAFFFRTVHTLLTGAYAAPCSCQLQHMDAFATAADYFKKYFRSDHIRPGPSGDAARDAALADLRTSLYCDWRAWPTYQQFALPLEYMLRPDADMLTSTNGCFPRNILASILCGQSAMVWGAAHVARDYFTGVVTLLLFALDCFDTAVSSLDFTSLFDLMLFVARLDASVAPVYPNSWHLGSKSEEGSGARAAGHTGQARHARTLLLGRQMVVARLPPLCFNGQGDVALRVEGLPPGRFHLCDTSGSWSFIPAQLGLPGGAFAEDGRVAKMLRVDSASWSNLGHSIMFLVPHFASALAEAYKSGGLGAVWRKREALRLYLYLPRGGRLALPEAKKPSVLLPWLELLSGAPPVLFADADPEEAARTPLPPPLELADSTSTRCHSAGEWGGPAPLASKEDLELFVTVARNFPGWRQQDLALLHSVWGRGSLDEAYRDPCLDPTTECVRVLLLQRSAVALSARRLVNVDRLVSWVESSYPSNLVRIAVASLEKYSYAQEIHLASRTDVLIGTFGSGMWWGIFMPAGACALWLHPWLHQPHLQMHEHHWRTDEPISRGPLWSKTSYLEYRGLRDLWHVQVFGALPPPGTPGRFALESPQAEASTGMGWMHLDIFVDMKLFRHAFKGIMRRLFKSSARRLANASERGT